jgi:glutathione S-transferase
MAAKITLIGRSTSVNVQKALWALHETKVEFEWKESDSQIGWPNNPDYLKINPNGRVPSLIVGDRIIRQSNVIVRYVAYIYARGSLWPEDPTVRAHSDEWMDWQQTELHQNLTPVFWGLVRTPVEKRDMKAINEAINKLNGNFTVLEGHLAERKWTYVAGDSFTMGDIPVGAALYRYMAMPIDRPSLPNVEAYYQRMLERPAFHSDIVMPLS